MSLIDALRKLQDLESNTVKLTKTPVHVQDMIQKIIADLDIAFEHQVPINFEHPSLPTMILADEIFLGGVFQNLIKNALEHVCKLDEIQRTVSVQILEDNQHVCVSVANLGPAIPQARLETFFDKFNTENKTGGTGLGTTYAFWVVRAHGGSIEVTSSEDMGTVVLVQLPLPEQK